MATNSFNEFLALQDRDILYFTGKSNHNGRNFSGIIHPSCVCLQLWKPAWHMGSKKKKRGRKKKVPNALHHCKGLIIWFGFSDRVPSSGVRYSGDGAAAGTMCARWGCSGCRYKTFSLHTGCIFFSWYWFYSGAVLLILLVVRFAFFSPTQDAAWDYLLLFLYPLQVKCSHVWVDE